MSVPLPPTCYRLNRSISLRNNPDASTSCSTLSIDDLFLDADERYMILRVKVAERPHLICHSEEFQDDTHESTMPLIDGYDLSGWRKHGIMVPADPSSRLYLSPLFNIGASSSMFRKDTQWPVFPRQVYTSPTYIQLLQKLQSPPVYDSRPHNQNQPLVLSYSDCCQPMLVSDPCVDPKRYGTYFSFIVEHGNIPAKILGATKGWSSMPSSTSCDTRDIRSPSTSMDRFQDGWTFENLLQRFGDVFWRFSDTHGETMTLDTYARYIGGPEGLADDSPLAIYDSEFGDEDSPTHELVLEYHTPVCFSQDLFEYADWESSPHVNRPPWRWILIGPERSGTGLHIDPLWTNAWVTILQGRKRWVLFPPNTPQELIGMTQPQIPSVVWFLEYYEKVMSEDWPEQWKPIEILQEAGETIFVPNGWPHLVLNLELTVAVTHNYASEYGPFERMCQQVIVDEPDFARIWYQGLRKARPDLADRMLRYYEEGIHLNQKWATQWSMSVVDSN